MRTPTLIIILTAPAVAGCSPENATAPEPPAVRSSAVAGFPDVIPLPDGFWPEGIAFGRGATST